MSSASDRPDAGLGERLRELDTVETAGDGELVDQMFSNLKARCDKSDRTLAGFLRSRSTTVRRSLVLSIFVALALKLVAAFECPIRHAPCNGRLLRFKGRAYFLLSSRGNYLLVGCNFGSLRPGDAFAA